MSNTAANIQILVISFFLHNFKLKTEVIIDKFGVIGLLHFHKGILPSHEAEFLFQKLQYA